MMPSPISYSNIASSYDRVRAMSKNNLSKWTSELIHHGKINENSDVLEIGYGTGRFTIPLWKQTHAEICGFDISSDMLEIAIAKEFSRNINWKSGNAEDLEFADSSFDCVFMIFVLHQIENPSRFLLKFTGFFVQGEL